MLEDLHNLMLADNSDAFSTVADDSYLGILAQVSSTPWNTVLGGSYDDAQVSGEGSITYYRDG